MPGRVQRLVVKFTRDVGSTLQAGDLILTGPNGQAVDPAQMLLRYNHRTHTARWTFPGLPGGVLPGGKYSVELRSDQIADKSGQYLDGNHNGQPGDNFKRGKPVKARHHVGAKRHAA